MIEIYINLDLGDKQGYICFNAVDSEKLKIFKMEFFKKEPRIQRPGGEATGYHARNYADIQKNITTKCAREPNS